jgi:hypothetical protein
MVSLCHCADVYFGTLDWCPNIANIKRPCGFKEERGRQSSGFYSNQVQWLFAKKKEPSAIMNIILTVGIQDGREGPYESCIDRSYHYRLISAKVKRPLCSISSILWKCLLSSLFTGNGWKISKFQGTWYKVPNMAAEPVTRSGAK